MAENVWNPFEPILNLYNTATRKMMKYDLEEFQRSFYEDWTIHITVPPNVRRVQIYLEYFLTFAESNSNKKKKSKKSKKNKGPERKNQIVKQDHQQLQPLPKNNSFSLPPSVYLIYFKKLEYQHFLFGGGKPKHVLTNLTLTSVYPSVRVPIIPRFCHTSKFYHINSLRSQKCHHQKLLHMQ